MRRLFAVLLLVPLLPIATLDVASAGGREIEVGTGLSDTTVSRGVRVQVFTQTSGAYRLDTSTVLQERVDGRGWVDRQRTEGGGRVIRFVVRPRVGVHVYRSVVRVQGYGVHRSAPATLTVLPRARVQVISVSWADPEGWESSTVRGRVLHMPVGSTVRLEYQRGDEWYWSEEERLGASGVFALSGPGANVLRTYRVVAIARHGDAVRGATSQVLTPVPELTSPLVPGGPALTVPAGGGRLQVDGSAGADLTLVASSEGRWEAYAPGGGLLGSGTGTSLRVVLPRTGSYALDLYPQASTPQTVRIVPTPIATIAPDGPPVALPDAPDGVPRFARFAVPSSPALWTVRHPDDGCLVSGHALTTTPDRVIATRGGGTHEIGTTCPTSVQVIRASSVAGDLDGTTVAWSTTKPGQIAVVVLPVVATTRVRVDLTSSVPIASTVLDLDRNQLVRYPGTAASYETTLLSGEQHVVVVKPVGEGVGSGTVTVSTVG